MSIERRNIALRLVLVAAAGTAWAQQYPTRPSRVNAAQSAGSSLDTRLMKRDR